MVLEEPKNHKIRSPNSAAIKEELKRREDFAPSLILDKRCYIIEGKRKPETGQEAGTPEGKDDGKTSTLSLTNTPNAEVIKICPNFTPHWV